MLSLPALAKLMIPQRCTYKCDGTLAPAPMRERVTMAAMPEDA